MPRHSSLSPDNILRFLQVTIDPVSTNEIASALQAGKGERQALSDMLVKLKRRRAIEELPEGRYQLAGRRRKQGGGAAAVAAGDGVGETGSAGTSSGGPGSTGNIRRQEPARSLARDEVRGRLVLHHDGYGFVVPDRPMPQLDGDVFIPPGAVEDAMHGDHVLVKLRRVSDFRGGGSRGPARSVR